MLTGLAVSVSTLEWRHNERDGVSNHQPHGCLLNRLFRRRSKKTSTLRVTGLCEGNSPVPGEFPAQRASNAENVSIWWRHHEKNLLYRSRWVTNRQLCASDRWQLHLNNLLLSWAFNLLLNENSVINDKSQGPYSISGKRLVVGCRSRRREIGV